MGTHHDDESVASGTDAPERLLLFQLGDESYGIRVAEIGGVASCGAIREVPGAPGAVLGLTEWRGSVLTVLDLPRLLEREAPGDPACLIRLAAPLEQTALHLPATVQLVEQASQATDASDLSPSESGTLRCMDTVRLVRPLELVRGLECELRGGG